MLCIAGTQLTSQLIGCLLYAFSQQKISLKKFKRFAAVDRHFGDAAKILQLLNYFLLAVFDLSLRR